MPLDRHPPDQPSSQPPIIVLGVSRSGTTLLREMLNHHSEVAIPSESHFLRPLWDRYRHRPSADALLADLACCRRVHQWGIDLVELRRRVCANATFSEVIQEVYRSYALARGKHRYGDKCPLHMQDLELLEQVFPMAQYVHIVRDGRDAALSFAGMRYRPRFSLRYPAWGGDFAATWRREVLGAQRFGSTLAAGRYAEVRYEDLIADPETRLRDLGSFLGLAFEPAMLEYYRDPHLTSTRHHERLREPPAPGPGSWRRDMSAADVARFEAIAGDVLERFGYERAHPSPPARARALAAADLAASGARLALGRLVMPAFHRSSAWRRRELRRLVT